MSSATKRTRLSLVVASAQALAPLLVLACSGPTKPQASAAMAASSASLAAPASPPLASSSASASSAPMLVGAPPARPCTPPVDWLIPIPKKPVDCRDAGRLCRDMTLSGGFPACSKETIDHTVTIEEYKKQIRMGMDYTKANIRGYLRRIVGLGTPRWPGKPAPTPDDHCGYRMNWEVGIAQESKTDDSCQHINLALELCHGDATVACCKTGLVDSNIEIVFESKESSICVVDPVNIPTPQPRFRKEDPKPKRLLD